MMDDLIDMAYVIEWNGLFLYHCNTEQSKMQESFGAKRQALLKANDLEKYQEFRKI